MQIIKRILCRRRRIGFLFIVVVFISAIGVLMISNTVGHFFQFIGIKNFIVDSPPSSRDNPKPGNSVPKLNLKKNETKAAKATDVDKDFKWNQYVSEKGLLQDNTSVLFRIDLPFDKNAYDILSMNPIKFDPVYKNPCWLGSETNGPIADGKLHCLPYFYLIGVKKSATTDLYSRIIGHPDYAGAGFKESQWIPRLRWGIFATLDRRANTGNYMSCRDLRSVDCFISMFDKAAQKIYDEEQERRNSSLITADCTPNTMYSHTNWKLLPGNEGLFEPKYTDFHYMKHLTPNVKIVIIMRDPVTRLYSDFMHTMGVWAYGQGKSTPEVFHEHVTQLTHAYNECFSRWSMRRCIYNGTMRHLLMREGILVADSFTAGFYAFYMKEMIDVFGKDRIHPILTKKYHENMETTLNDLFAFLDMRKLQPPEMERITEKTGKLVRKNKTEMLSETRDLLYEYYIPYNQEMANLMKDDRYLFPQQPK